MCRFKQIIIGTRSVQEIFVIGKFFSEALNQITTVTSQATLIKERTFCIKSYSHNPLIYGNDTKNNVLRGIMVSKNQLHAISALFIANGSEEQVNAQF
jgi:hypothetical protein